MNAATSEQMLAVVKWWARVRGFLRHPGFVPDKTWSFEVGTEGGLLVELHGDRGRYWVVSASVALAWALLVESDAGPVWAGKCWPCDGEGCSPSATWQPRHPGQQRPDHVVCEVCKGAKEKWVPAAVLLLDAVENVASCEYLAAHADKLLADGNPIGELLVWALNLWMVDSDLRHAHTDEAVRWLEWLTWGNWFTERHRLQVLARQHDDQRDALPSSFTQGELRGDDFDFAIMDESMQSPQAARVYADSLFAEQTFGEAGETYSIRVAGHTYSMRLRTSITAAALAAAFNQQGGPATFAANDHGLSMDMHETGSASFVVTSASGPAAELLGFVEPPPPEEPRRRQHAEHIGSRLGRRLGVRR